MRNRRSLFEVLNKTPPIQSYEKKSGGLFGWRRRQSEPPLMVAEALTEEEAAAELAAQRAVRNEAERAKRERLEAKYAKKAAKKAAKAAAREAAKKAVADVVAAQGEPGAKAPLFRFVAGRLVISLNSAACVAVAAVFCVLLLGSYSLGHRSVGPWGPSELAAMTKGSPDGGMVADSNDSNRESVGEASASAEDPDLSMLLRPPPTRGPSAMANQPVSIESDGPPRTPEAAKANYLAVEFFRITREQSGEDLKKELDDVRRFLAKQNIKTFARRSPKGFSLYASKGFSPANDNRKQREAFRRKVEELGKLYRKSGGRYQFKGCYFVSYAQATSGKPA